MRGCDVTGDDYPGKRVYEALGWEDAPEHQERDVKSYMEAYRDIRGTDDDTTFFAFNALREIAINKTKADGNLDKDFGGVEPDASQEVPWWIVYTLSAAWTDYTNPTEDRRSFGQTFGIEGDKQGAHTTSSKQRTLRKGQGLALEVAFEMACGGTKTKTAAIEAVSEKFGASDGTVRDALKNHKATFDKCLVQLREKVPNSSP
jgi:hypothetical protein